MFKTFSYFALIVSLFLASPLWAAPPVSWTQYDQILLGQEEDDGDTMTIMADLQNKGAQAKVVKRVYEVMRKQLIKAEKLGEVWREKSLGLTSGQSIVDKCREPENSACLLAWVKDTGAQYLIAGRLRAMDDEMYIIEARLLHVSERVVINQVESEPISREALLNASAELACELAEDFGCSDEDLMVTDEVLAPVDPDANNPSAQDFDDEGLYQAEPTASQSEPSEPFVWKDRDWGWVVLGVGVAAAATGSAMMVMAKTSYDKYGDATTKSDADSYRQDTETFAYTGYGMFALAGAAAVGSTLLLILLDDKPEPEGSGGMDSPRLQVAPQLVPGFSGLLLQGELP